MRRNLSTPWQDGCAPRDRSRLILERGGYVNGKGQLGEAGDPGRRARAPGLPPPGAGGRDAAPPVSGLPLCSARFPRSGERPSLESQRGRGGGEGRRLPVLVIIVLYPPLPVSPAPRAPFQRGRRRREVRAPDQWEGEGTTGGARRVGKAFRRADQQLARRGMQTCPSPSSFVPPARADPPLRRKRRSEGHAPARPCLRWGERTRPTRPAEVAFMRKGHEVFFLRRRCDTRQILYSREFSAPHDSEPPKRRDRWVGEARGLPVRSKACGGSRRADRTSPPRAAGEPRRNQ